MHHLYLCLALLAGIVLPMQIGLNTAASKATAAPIWAAALSFTVGAISLFAYILLSRQPWPAMTAIAAIPPYAWAAGLLGAFYVTITIIAAPKIGAAMLIALVVAGQMTAAVIMDHYGTFGFPQHSMNWGRIAGAVMVVAGVVLIRKF